MGVNGGGGGSGGSDIYYSTPAEMMMEQISSKGPSRILNEEGVFVTRDAYASQSSLESNQGVQSRLRESMSLQRYNNIPTITEIILLKFCP